jgi:hypothetical protein
VRATRSKAIDIPRNELKSVLFVGEVGTEKKQKSIAQTVPDFIVLPELLPVKHSTGTAVGILLINHYSRGYRYGARTSAEEIFNGRVSVNVRQ